MAASGSGSFVKRSWRRFRRRPMSTQAFSWVLLLVIVGGVVFGITASSSTTKTPSGTTATTVPLTAPETASTSSRGVTATSIRVVFPVSNLTSLSSTEGFAGDIEFTQQNQAINTFVNAINAAGGINGRKIIADIVNFDPTSETSMRSLCKQWTQGSPPVFAVLDGIGAWTGDNELCVTQEGHTPFIGQWTTIESVAPGRIALPVVDRTEPVADPRDARQVGHAGRALRAGRRWASSKETARPISSP